MELGMADMRVMGNKRVALWWGIKLAMGDRGIRGKGLGVTG